MTGFGKSSGVVKGGKIWVEIRSVNNKGLDVNLRLPGFFSEKETEIRNFLSKELKRGKIDVVVTVDSALTENHVSINKTIVRKHYTELKSLCRELKLDDEEMLLAVLRMPDIFIPKKKKFMASDWKAVLNCIRKAVSALDKFRISEGRLLQKDLRKRIAIILQYLLQINKMDGGRVKAIREKIIKKLEENISSDKIDNNRFQQELIYYLEKLDITEEKVRLETHCNYFLKTMRESESGRKLSFIAQEIGREINTIGSKANNANMQKIVVQMKDELEKIKEQLNNVL